MDLLKASHRLSEIDIKIITDSLKIEILWFRVMKNQGNWKIERHTHSSYEFHFVQSGSSRVLLDNREFEVSKGEFYLTAPGIYHEQTNKGTEDYIEYSINCDMELINDKSSEESNMIQILNNSPCKNYKDSLGIIKLFDQALYEAYHQPFGFYTQIKSIVFSIVIKAARIMNQDSSITYSIPMKNKKYDYRYMQIEKYVKDNISNGVTTTNVAHYMYLSNKQVYRIVKQRKGISTQELISRIKLEKAKKLLKETNESIHQISDSLGFSSPYYFNQFFKKQEGYPPGRFRKNVKDV